MGDENEQQYIAVGTNMYVGTKDGMKYTLVKTSDSKYRLVEALNHTNISFDTSDGSLSSPISNKIQNVSTPYEKTLPRKESKLIKLVAVKSEPSPCKGQGDEAENSVLSSPATFNESYNAVGEISAPSEDSKLTYTVLLPRQEKVAPPPNLSEKKKICYSTPQNVYYNYPTEKPKRGRPRSTSRFAFPGACSPIPRTRSYSPRKKSLSSSSYQYTPQLLHSTPSGESVFTSFSKTTLSTISRESSGLSESSVECPRVPDNTPNSSQVLDVSSNQDIFSLQWVPDVSGGAENYISSDPRETHNENERKRRQRIKNACQYIKSLLPGATRKTDCASAFEQALNFIKFIRNAVGTDHDIEFLEQIGAF